MPSTSTGAFQKSKKGLKATGQEARIKVSKTAFGQESEETEHIEIRPFATVPAKVAVSFSRTINLGNYESEKVSVMMEVPCYREELLSMYPKLVDAVVQRLDMEVAKIAKATGRDIDVEEFV